MKVIHEETGIPTKEIYKVVFAARKSRIVYFAKDLELVALLRFWEKWSMGEEGRAGGSGW